MLSKKYFIQDEEGKAIRVSKEEFDLNRNKLVKETEVIVKDIKTEKITRFKTPQKYKEFKEKKQRNIDELQDKK